MSSMAESVNHLLSAVTEGHLSNSTASQTTQIIDQAFSKSAGADNRGKKSTRSATVSSESAYSNRRGRKKHATEALETTESSNSQKVRKFNKRQDEQTESTTETATSAKTASANKLKRHHKASRTNNQPEPIEISSDEEIPVEKKVKNCIASRTRSKAHHSPPSPHKKPKLTSRTSSTSPGVENNIATLGSNIRKTSTRHHNTESVGISASRRTPTSVLATAHETNSFNNNVSAISRLLIGSRLPFHFHCIYMDFCVCSFACTGITIVKSDKSTKTQFEK